MNSVNNQRPTRTARLDLNRPARDIRQNKNGDIICGCVTLICKDEHNWIVPGGKIITGKLNAIALARRINFNINKGKAA